MSISKDKIIEYIAAHPDVGRKDITRAIAPDASSTTTWRLLKQLVDENRLEVIGNGPATRYRLAGVAAVRTHLATPYHRRKPVSYNRDFIDRYIPNSSCYLSAIDRARLSHAGTFNTPPELVGTHAQQVLERVLVDLSWASSRMEGNTYSILDTERLIQFGEEASGKNRKEAIMILNHKWAIQYVAENLEDITISRIDICNIHALLSDGLLTNPAMYGRTRLMPVSIGHSSYRPPDDQFEIDEEFNILIDKAAAINDPFEQSFFLLVQIPYLQAFDDVNKRTSRVVSNIPLMKAQLAPMSFLTMEDRDYIDGLLGIYELNNVALLREAFIEAYTISAENYRELRAEVDNPEKAALEYRDFVKEAVRCCVLDRKAFDALLVTEMATTAGIPGEDHAMVVNYVDRQICGLHEGNAIRYRLTPTDLEPLLTHGSGTANP